MENFYKIDGNTLIINVLGTPGAKNDSFGKVVGDRLKIFVKKNAENGEATKYMKKFLAGNFGVPLKNVSLIYGETSREKAFKIEKPLTIPQKLKKLITLDNL